MSDYHNQCTDNDNDSPLSDAIQSRERTVMEILQIIVLNSVLISAIEPTVAPISGIWY